MFLWKLLANKVDIPMTPKPKTPHSLLAFDKLREGVKKGEKSCTKDCYDEKYSAGRTVRIVEGEYFCPRCGGKIAEIVDE